VIKRLRRIPYWMFMCQGVSACMRTSGGRRELWGIVHLFSNGRLFRQEVGSRREPASLSAFVFPCLLHGWGVGLCGGWAVWPWG
jgi:hypothetical protein